MTDPVKRWDRLFETAAAQEGLFTARQAVEAGFSLPLVAKHVRSGRVAHVQRGIYRLVHFPAGDHEDLVVVWLWSDRTGVFSHETALALHELSDALPHRSHLTVPRAWRQRRLRVPKGVVLHYRDLPSKDRAWAGPIPVTALAETLRGCVEDHVDPDLVRQAVRQALASGLVRRADVAGVASAVRRADGTRR